MPLVLVNVIGQAHHANRSRHARAMPQSNGIAAVEIDPLQFH
jgi:hypothetical protein